MSMRKRSLGRVQATRGRCARCYITHFQRGCLAQHLDAVCQLVPDRVMPVKLASSDSLVRGAIRLARQMGFEHIENILVKSREDGRYKGRYFIEAPFSCSDFELSKDSDHSSPLRHFAREELDTRKFAQQLRKSRYRRREIGGIEAVKSAKYQSRTQSIILIIRS